MGLFSKKPSYPELDSGNPAAEQIHEVEQPLKDLMGQVSDPLEVVPSEDCTYVFIGKPPKKFGVAKIEEGQVKSFVAVAKEKGLDQVKIQKLNEQFRDAYTHNMDAQRYMTSVAGKAIVVTPSAQLGQEVSQIMNSM
ncbi:MAG: hypothetical protein OEL80_02800 [Desulfuromonadales bacterium]|jgi:hypothetical protein|nr:hypothetical protein [Desulfuromonadales bacterium]